MRATTTITDWSDPAEALEARIARAQVELPEQQEVTLTSGREVRIGLHCIGGLVGATGPEADEAWAIANKRVADHDAQRDALENEAIRRMRETGVAAHTERWQANQRRAEATRRAMGETPERDSA